MGRMSLSKFGRYVAGVMDTLPEQFQPFLKNLVVDVKDEPDERTLREQGFTPEEIADGETLYGLFVPFPQQLSLDDAGAIDAEHEHPLHPLVIYKKALAEGLRDP